MTKRSLQVLVVLALVSASSFAAKERVIKVQNTVRLGFDDNIYQTENKTSSAYITDVVNLSAKLNFSSRTDALVYWEPEFQYRFDADPKFITYQSLYARLNHAISQRLFLTLSDRFRYQQKEAQAGGGTSAPSTINQNYFENNLMGALDFNLNNISFLKLGAGYDFRIWDDSDYGDWNNGTGGGNNYNALTGNLSYNRQLKPNKTLVMGGLNYNALSYEGDRGGYDSATLLLGVDQNFSPTVNGFGRFGWSANMIDNANGGSSDTSAPYLQLGLGMEPSARSSVTTSLGYQLYRSENSYYNAQDRLNFILSGRHEITAKIALSGSFNYTYSMYDGSFRTDIGSAAFDANDQYLSMSLRCAYQINRNNFIEAGYMYRTRLVDVDTVAANLNEWDSNRVDLSWRLRL